jgi:uncharacterized protein (TIGR04255 family)
MVHKAGARLVRECVPSCLGQCHHARIVDVLGLSQSATLFVRIPMANTRAKVLLPKAPLAEVVFELRWALQAAPPDVPILQPDPGLIPLLDRFTKEVKKIGFGSIRDMSHPLQTGTYGVVRRFYKANDRPFPIMQIGPGIFATNESSEYAWKPFKKQAKQGMRALLRSYPKLDFFSLKLIHIELRYIDAFPASLVGNAALFPFLEKQTTLRIGLPEMLTDKKIFEPDVMGRFHYRAKLKGRKQSELTLDLGSGKNAETGEELVRMETKVISLGPDVPTLRNNLKAFRAVDLWLEMAHGITSPLFRELIKRETLAKYRIGS